MTADLFDDRLKFYACLVGRDQAHEAVEPPVQIGLVDLERAVGKSVASTPDGAGALEQALQAGREHRVARVDRVLDVADEMREADLMLARCPAHLAAIAVRNPVIRAPIAEERMHDRLGAVFGGDEDGAVGVMEHPEPPIALADPHPGFVRGQRGARQEPRLDQARLRGKRLSAGVEDVDQRAFANVQAEQVAQHVAQSRQRNALDRAQIDHKGAQVWPERRSRLQALRRLGLEALGATRADAAMQRHARHVGLDLRDFDAVIGFARALRDAGYVGAAALARAGEDIAPGSRVGMKRTMCPDMRLGLALGRGWLRRLSPFAR